MTINLKYSKTKTNMKTYSNIDYDSYSDLNEYDIDALNQWLEEREQETEQYVEYTYNLNLKEAK